MSDSDVEQSRNSSAQMIRGMHTVIRDINNQTDISGGICTGEITCLLVKQSRFYDSLRQISINWIQTPFLSPIMCENVGVNNSPNVKA